MGLLGHMCIPEGGIHRSLEKPSTSCTPTVSSPTYTPSPSAPTISSSATITETDPDTADLSCPYCPRSFTLHIGLVGHLRIHLTETGEPVPGAPTYIRRIRLNLLHRTRRTGLSGYMRIHENLR
ncbi:hypothetical protein SprV_0100027300 [Sparganum proliferum]